jgi:hypothetical protein
MHYADGTPAKHGDLVIHTDGGKETVGIVTNLTAGSDTCNANMIALAQRQTGSEVWFPLAAANGWYATLKNCLKLPQTPPATES